MPILYIICEGQTEETFIKEVLAPHFISLSKPLYLIPILLGGHVDIQVILLKVRNLLANRDAYCTTLFDFYGLPNKFPGKQDATDRRLIQDKAGCVTRAMQEHARPKLGEQGVRHFIPYLQMYEFEGLLFSDPEGFANSIARRDLAQHFIDIRAQFPTPEDINDSTETAPSKRILGCMRDYEKPIHGNIAMLDLGLAPIRRECKLFNEWVMQLEILAQ